ncbi:MAG: hypothetical protein ACT4RN_12260, partial [Pseudonocardia sp.]
MQRFVVVVGGRCVRAVRGLVAACPVTVLVLAAVAAVVWAGYSVSPVTPAPVLSVPVLPVAVSAPTAMAAGPDGPWCSTDCGGPDLTGATGGGGGWSRGGGGGSVWAGLEDRGWSGQEQQDRDRWWGHPGGGPIEGGRAAGFGDGATPVGGGGLLGELFAAVSGLISRLLDAAGGAGTMQALDDPTGTGGERDRPAGWNDDDRAQAVGGRIAQDGPGNHGVARSDGDTNVSFANRHSSNNEGLPPARPASGAGPGVLTLAAGGAGGGGGAGGFGGGGGRETGELGGQVHQLVSAVLARTGLGDGAPAAAAHRELMGWRNTAHGDHPPHSSPDDDGDPSPPGFARRTEQFPGSGTAAPQTSNGGPVEGDGGGRGWMTPDGSAMSVPTHDGRTLTLTPQTFSPHSRNTPDPAQGRYLIEIDNQQAPGSYDYRLDMPAGARAVANPHTGGVDILDTAGRPIQQIGTPWARDAHGADLPTRFDVIDHADGTATLRQHVAFDEHTAYPVLADPPTQATQQTPAQPKAPTNKQTKQAKQEAPGNNKTAGSNEAPGNAGDAKAKKKVPANVGDDKTNKAGTEGAPDPTGEGNVEPAPNKPTTHAPTPAPTEVPPPAAPTEQHPPPGAEGAGSGGPVVHPASHHTDPPPPAGTDPEKPPPDTDTSNTPPNTTNTTATAAGLIPGTGEALHPATSTDEGDPVLSLAAADPAASAPTVGTPGSGADELLTNLLTPPTGTDPADVPLLLANLPDTPDGTADPPVPGLAPGATLVEPTAGDTPDPDLPPLLAEVLDTAPTTVDPANPPLPGAIPGAPRVGAPAPRPRRAPPRPPARPPPPPPPPPP